MKQSVISLNLSPLNRGSVLASLAILSTVTGVVAQPRYAVTDLGVLPGYSLSVANNINDNGDIVGYCSTSSSFSTTVATVWRNGSMINLGKLPGGIYSSATALNSIGGVVGDGDTGNYRPQAWVSTSAGLY